jgi:SAM-dependent methyltransferase
MHGEARNFTLFLKAVFPDSFQNKRVLDVGSGDINGNNRFLFDNCEYDGNDVIAAANVTVVSRTKDLEFADATFDTIISTECFEHDPEYAESFRKIYRMLKPGGLFCFSCASTGRHEHGTRRTTPHDSYGTIGRLEDMSDYYKNLTIKDVDRSQNLDSVFSMWKSFYNGHSCDLYFYGFKRGPRASPPVYENPGVVETTL